MATINSKLLRRLNVDKLFDYLDWILTIDQMPGRMRLERLETLEPWATLGVGAESGGGEWRGGRTCVRASSLGLGFDGYRV